MSEDLKRATSMSPSRPRRMAKHPGQKRPVVERRFASKALQLAQSIYLASGSALGRRMYQSSVTGDYMRCVSTSVDPGSYADPVQFRDDYLVASLLAKADFLPLGVDREAAALSGFKSAEANCATTNQRLSRRYVNGLYSSITPESIMVMARRKIARLLGPLNWDEVELSCRFGPGASVSVPHRRGDAYYKMGEKKPTTTYGCAILSYTALHRVPRWFQHVATLSGVTPEAVERMEISERISTLFTVVPGNRVTFVPKDARKDRTIAIEPTMNGFIQHGLGSVLRRRFGRVKLAPGLQRLSLDDQSLNQMLAREGSIDGTLATLDLSAASDSVSLRLVEELFPTDWYHAFCMTRSPVGVLPDGTHCVYSKVSSMGNGYTFELESIIFWALCRTVVDLLCLRDRRVSVYGDDIIVPVDAVPTIRWMMQWWGFTLNADKSFWSGEFRESCGKHFFRGLDVTPIYIRKDIDSADRVIWFANQVRRYSRLSWGMDSRWQSCYSLAVSFLPPRRRRPSIPDGIGDYALIGDLDEVCPTRASNGLDGWIVRVSIPVIKTRRYADVPYLLRSLAPHEYGPFSQTGPLPTSVIDRVVGLIVRPGKILGDVRSIALSKVGWFREAPIPCGISTGMEVRRSVRIFVSNWPSFGPFLTE